MIIGVIGGVERHLESELFVPSVRSTRPDIQGGNISLYPGKNIRNQSHMTV